jgi:hypothetical protein
MTDPPNDLVSSQPENPWPLGAYAPGGYHCRCVRCEVVFEGDKRAMNCLPCALQGIRSALTSRDARIAELEKALTVIAQGRPTEHANVFEQLSGDDCSLIARQALSSSQPTGGETS